MVSKKADGQMSFLPLPSVRVLKYGGIYEGTQYVRTCKAAISRILLCYITSTIQVQSILLSPIHLLLPKRVHVSTGYRQCVTDSLTTYCTRTVRPRIRIPANRTRRHHVLVLSIDTVGRVCAPSLWVACIYERL